MITPGAHFGIGRYIRIGYGYDVGKTLEGLARVDELLGELQGHGRTPEKKGLGGSVTALHREYARARPAAASC